MKVWTDTERVPARLLADMKAPYNPRKIRKDAQDRLTTSLDEFGQVEPLVCNRRTGHIVGGHQRVEAALNLDEDAELFVVWVDLDLDEEKALNVMLNNPAAQGEWDDQRLAKIAHELWDAGGRALVAAAGWNRDDITRITLRAQGNARRALQAANKGKKGSKGKDGGDGEDEEQVLLTLAMAPADRKTVYRAINLAQNATDSATKAQALVKICEEYLAERT